MVEDVTREGGRATLRIFENEGPLSRSTQAVIEAWEKELAFLQGSREEATSFLGET